jgi:hypothetical protein
MDLHLFSNTIPIVVVADILLSRVDNSVADYHWVILCMFDGGPIRAVQKQIDLLFNAHGGCCSLNPYT